MLKKVLKTLLPIRIRFALKSSFFWEISILLTELHFIKRSFYGNSLEDKVIFELLPDLNGTYIDIGSGRPISGSNTYFFYKRGWKGILIDPLTINKKTSRILRRKDSFIQGVITNSNDESLEFYEFLPYGNSTTLKEIADKQLHTPGFYLVQKNKVKNININKLPGLSPELPSLLTIDTEGRDLEILKGMDFKRMRPKVIVVEAWTPDALEEINAFLQPKGYVFHIRCGDSVIFQFKNNASI